MVLGVGLVTPLRWLGRFTIFVSRLRGRLRSTSNTDEGWLAAALRESPHMRDEKHKQRSTASVRERRVPWNSAPGE